VALVLAFESRLALVSIDNLDVWIFIIVVVITHPTFCQWQAGEAAY
jgi:hypothetical protein